MADEAQGRAWVVAAAAQDGSDGDQGANTGHPEITMKIVSPKTRQAENVLAGVAHLVAAGPGS